MLNSSSSSFFPAISESPMFVSENGSLQTSSNGTVATLFSPFGVVGADSNNYSCVVVNATGIVTVITIDIRVMGEKLEQQYLQLPYYLYINWSQFS